MIRKTIHFFCIILTALAMSGGLAHLYALPNKLHLSKMEYLTVQQIYRGWDLLGIAIVGAIILLIILAILMRCNTKVFWLIIGAIMCVMLGLVDFFIYTYPANQQTHNWMILPNDWQVLRLQWEYSHAAGALLYFSAFSLITLAAFVNKGEKKKLT